MKYFFILVCFSCFVLPLSANNIRQYDFVVARDGSGDFKTLKEVINAIPDWRKKRTTVFIKNGVYKEKLTLPETKQDVTFFGESADSTIITYDDYASRKNIFGEEMGTGASAGFFIYAAGFIAENITFQNTAGPVGQAVAVLTAGDKMQFINCKFLGFQDTLCTWGAGTRQYFKNCYIEGTVDFIFGPATVWFDSCTLFCKKGGFVTAASTPENSKYGYVFFKCTVTGEDEASFFLGRPWRPFAKVVFIKCRLDKVIIPEGWNNWDNTKNEITTFFAEYCNTGAAAFIDKRVKWSHHLTDKEAGQYNLTEVFKDWNVAYP